MPSLKLVYFLNAGDLVTELMIISGNFTVPFKLQHAKKVRDVLSFLRPFMPPRDNVQYGR